MSKGFKTWRYRKYANSIIPGLQVETDDHKRSEFYEALKELILVIHDHISEIINYDHISYIVPKYELNLKYENRHYCLAYVNSEGNMVYLFMKVIPKEKLSQKVKVIIWRKRSP